MTRAFDSINPTSVRVVLLGQDPYPSRTRATGRAFEDGAWTGNFTKLADSMQPILRSALALAWDEPTLHNAHWDWDTICARLQNDYSRDAMSGFFNKLAEQGVLSVNAAWTRTRKKDEVVHRELWRPVIDYLLGKLAVEAERPVVFMLLGDKAACSLALLIRFAGRRQSSETPIPAPNRTLENSISGDPTRSRVSTVLCETWAIAAR